MPGEMTQLLYAEIQALLNTWVPNASSCTVCGGVQTVSLSMHLVTPVVTSVYGGIQLAAQQYPQAMLICSDCGNTTYYNYIVLKNRGLPHGQ